MCGWLQRCTTGSVRPWLWSGEAHGRPQRAHVARQPLSASAHTWRLWSTPAGTLHGALHRGAEHVAGQ